LQHFVIGTAVAGGVSVEMFTRSAPEHVVDGTGASKRPPQPAKLRYHVLSALDSAAVIRGKAVQVDPIKTHVERARNSTLETII
jgi:hypothetical protein